MASTPILRQRPKQFLPTRAGEAGRQSTSSRRCGHVNRDTSDVSISHLLTSSGTSPPSRSTTRRSARHYPSNVRIRCASYVAT
jgi:hypothetical protein